MHTAVPAIPRPRPPIDLPPPHHPLTAATPGRHRRELESPTRGEFAISSAAAVGRVVTALALVVFAAAAVATTTPGSTETASTFVSGGGR